MTIEERLANKTTEEISNIIVELDKEKLLLAEAYHEFRKALHKFDLAITTINQHKQKLKMNLDDVRLKKQRVEIELTIAREVYWQKK